MRRATKLEKGMDLAGLLFGLTVVAVSIYFFLLSLSFDLGHESSLPIETLVMPYLAWTGFLLMGLLAVWLFGKSWRMWKNETERD